jgi:SAM-dependent methyltransferase/catechol 2,3-dioxygenase-like lactoylglutathione lyase family enzyme
VVWRLLERITPGRALDAPCGTGRHTLRLAELGHDVVAVDATDAMLARARDKAPAARFLRGDLRELPLDDDAVDLAVCALSLEHLEHLEQPVRELARVIRPGGTLIISETHPTIRAVGGAPFFRDATGAGGVVRSYNHSHGDYLDAFADAGLEVRRCVDVRFSHEQVAMQEPAASLYPEAAAAAMLGLPAILIWDLAVPSPGGRASLDHVQVAAPPGCEPAARRFYGELLELVELQKPSSLRDRGGVWFGLGRQQLHVGVQEPFAPAEKAHPALSVAADELDALAARLRAAGAPVRWDESLPGERRFYTEDPWGNRIELLSRAPRETPPPAA